MLRTPQASRRPSIVIIGLRLFFAKADVTVVTHDVSVVFLSAKYIHKYFHIVFVPKATEFGEITRRLAITPFSVIQGHRVWYQSKAHMRLPISHLLINSNLPPIFHRFQVMVQFSLARGE